MQHCKPSLPATRPSGFTLIEIVVVITLLTIVSTIGGLMLTQAFQAGYASQDLITANWQTRLAVARMSRDIREILAATSTGITSFGSSSLSFVTLDGESVSYSVSSNTLVRNSLVLADGVSSITFGYLNEDGLSTGTVTDIRYITTTLVVNFGNTNNQFRTLVFPRSTP